MIVRAPEETGTPWGSENQSDPRRVHRRLPQACVTQNMALSALLSRSTSPPAVFNTTMQFENYICIQDNKKPYFLEKPVVCVRQWSPVELWRRRQDMRTKLAHSNLQMWLGLQCCGERRKQWGAREVCPGRQVEKGPVLKGLVPRPV